MNNVSSICFGRFLIDLPEGSEVKEIGQQSEFMFGPVVSEGPEVDAKKFAARMEKREAELKAVAANGEYKFSKSLSPLPNAKILVSSRTLFGSTAYAFDAGRVVNGELFSIKQESFSAKKIDSVLDGLQNKLLPQLRTRKPDEIPAEPGFCIKNGFIANDGSDRTFEEARIQIKLKEWPDLWVTIYSRTVSKGGQKTLLERVDGNPMPAALSPVAGQMRTLRKGKHAVGGIPGEEVLDVLPTEEGFKVHDFTWEAQGGLNDPFKPTLHLEFSSGNGQASGHHIRPTMTDEQATKVFDSIVNSIRLRPTGPAKVSSAEPAPSSPAAPLGAVVATGSICPQTGLWQCIETGNIDGGRRRFFKAGEAMPAAVLLGDANIWQSLRGQRPSHSLNTVWSLVAYEEIAAAPVAAAAKTDADNTPGTSLPGEPTPG